ncbi:hypothetical protein TNCV_3665841 [Trichonephila clavipes]|nr:hypothetical protein TNCV_3665841 [Trichonephila clavipes]
MSNDFVKDCKICQLRKPITYRDRVPIQPLVRPEIPFLKYGVWTVLGRWNPFEGTIILLFAQLIYARRWVEAIPVKKISAKTTQRPSENFHTNSKSGTSWVDLRSRLRFRGPSLCSVTDMAVRFMGGDVTDHISSDCQELDDVQRLELLNTLGKFSSLFSSLPGLAKQEVDRQSNELLHLKLIEPGVKVNGRIQLFVVSKKNGSISELCVGLQDI